MTRTRATLSLTLALLMTSALGAGAIAQAPSPDLPAPGASDGCAGPAGASGMMSGDDASMHPGPMGGPEASMGHGMMESHHPTESPAAAASISPDSVRFDVTLTDAFRILPCAMTVQAGVPVTFVVTNVGAIDHEFFLGDAAQQVAHDEEMITMGEAAMHGDDHGMTVHPGETVELSFTFEQPGEFEAGCHIPGHYPAGMKARITVVA